VDTTNGLGKKEYKMKELSIDMFNNNLDDYAIVVTTNGIVKANGELVMGAGTVMYINGELILTHSLATILGDHVKRFGNTLCHVMYDNTNQWKFISFPTNDACVDFSNKLIEKLAHSLVKLANSNSWETILLPRSNCGIGGLLWADVKAVLEPILDDRFIIVTPPTNQQPATSVIDKFDGEFRFLSNFWPCKIQVKELVFDSVEAAYQACKCANEADRAQFVGMNAGAAKRLGQQIEIRPDWDEQRLKVMAFCLKQKFAPGSELANKLIDTYPNFLIEGDYWNDTYYWNDAFWGVCNGVGDNRLGLMLMKIRDHLDDLMALERRSIK
jgi:ribA/ribD-fused uncharacterized protein